MDKITKIAVIAVLVAAVGVIFVLKHREPSSPVIQDANIKVNSTTHAEKIESSLAGQARAKALPRLVDLGADKCIPCKMMAPILEELKSEYEGRLIVDFIDVWKNPAEAPKYGIKLIPTQIFFDASGEELFRHEGFYSKEDILAKWEELGVELAKAE